MTARDGEGPATAPAATTPAAVSPIGDTYLAELESGNPGGLVRSLIARVRREQARADGEERGRHQIEDERDEARDLARRGRAAGWLPDEQTRRTIDGWDREAS